MARIRIIEPSEADSGLKEIYDSLASSRGKLAEVHKLQSLNPPTIPAHMDLYMKIMFSRSPLSRAEREMMAVVVSVTNGCEYCREHHLEALKHFWPEYEAMAIARLDAYAAGLDDRLKALFEYARGLTADPQKASADDYWVDHLRAVGLDDRGILDATLVISYFNFVNRMVMGLGVELESDPGGYRYESASE